MRIQVQNNKILEEEENKKEKGVGLVKHCAYSVKRANLPSLTILII